MPRPHSAARRSGSLVGSAAACHRHARRNSQARSFVRRCDCDAGHTSQSVISGRISLARRRGRRDVGDGHALGGGAEHRARVGREIVEWPPRCAPRAPRSACAGCGRCRAPRRGRGRRAPRSARPRPPRAARASTSRIGDGEQRPARFSSARAGARVAVSIAGQSRGRRRRRIASTIVVPSVAPKTSPANPRLGGPRRRAPTTSASTASSVRVGSWWNSASRRTSPATRDVDRVLDRAVAPPDLVRVLLREVLGVVDQQVGAAHERRCAARPRGRVLATAVRRRGRRRPRSARGRWSTRRSRRRPRSGTRASTRDGGGSAS